MTRSAKAAARGPRSQTLAPRVGFDQHCRLQEIDQPETVLDKVTTALMTSVKASRETHSHRHRDG